MHLKIKGILSFPHLFQPRIVKAGDEAKYYTDLLVRKDDPSVQTILSAIAQEKANGWPSASGFPASGKLFMHDGAETIQQPDGSVVHKHPAQLHNFMIIKTNAKADQKPAVVDTNLQPVMDPALAYPGAVAYVAFNTFVYKHSMSCGISAGLNAVMLTGEEGELGRLDNRPTVEQLFGDITNAPAIPAATPIAAPGMAPTAPAPAPAPAPTIPPTAPVPPSAPPAQPQYVMTPAANGMTREQYIAAGWTDIQLVQNGLMQPPVVTSF